MKKLDIWHHKIIFLLLMLGVFVGGVVFGIRLNSASGIDGMQVISFAMILTLLTLSFITFTQVIHLRDDIELKKR